MVFSFLCTKAGFVNIRRLREGALVVALCVQLSLLSGCGSNEKAVERETSNLKPLAVLYGKYRSQNRGQAPPNEEALKAFVKGLSQQERDSAGAKGDVESMFISSRDNKPYKFVFGGSGMPDDVVVYEQAGADGKRYVGTSVGAVKEVDDAEFRKLVPSAP